MQTPLQPVKRGAVYHVRFHVPADLWPRVGRTQIWRSLHTGDLRIAHQRARAACDAARAYFHHVRTRGRFMDRSQLDSLARRYLSTRFDQAENALALEWDDTGRDVWGDELEDQCGRLTAALASCDYSGAMDDARSMLPEGDADTQRKLARRLLEAQLEAHKATLRALSGEPLVFPSLVSVASPAANDDPKETPRLSEVLAAYVEERTSQGKWTPKTKLQREIVGAAIVSLLGDPCVGDVTKDDMRTFGLTVPRLPSNVNKRFPGVPIAEVLARVGDDPKVARLSAKTVNLYLQLARSLFAWAVEHDKITNSPAVVLHDHDEGDPQDKRHPFTDADIVAIMAELAKPTKGSPYNGQPWVHWIPRIVAYSGMRLGECAQLRKCDVRTVDGVPVFDVNDEGDDDTADTGTRRIKTYASRRVFPVHPRLIELGLLDFVAAQPDGYLWPSPPRVDDEVRNASHNLSRFINRRIRKAGITSAKKVQHGFRHTVMQRLDDAEVPTHVTKAIVGHTNRDITTGVYGSRPSPAKMLVALEKLSLPI